MNRQTSCKLYPFDPIQELARQGASLLINISASPFYYGKEEIRYQIIRQHCRKYQLPFIYVNQVGGNDELIFDGCSLALDAQGELLKALPGFSRGGGDGGPEPGRRRSGFPAHGKNCLGA